MVIQGFIFWSELGLINRFVLFSKNKNKEIFLRLYPFQVVDFIEKGANPNKEDKDGKIALDFLFSYYR